MKKCRFTLGILLLALVMLSSCKKEKAEMEEDEDCELTVAAIAGKYKLVATAYVEATGDRDALHDIYEDCERDDINELKADKTFEYTDGGAVCEPTGSESGSWSCPEEPLFSTPDSPISKALIVRIWWLPTAMELATL